MAISTFPVSAGGGGRTAKAFKASGSGGTFATNISAGVYEVSGNANFPVIVGGNEVKASDSVLILNNNATSITLQSFVSSFSSISNSFGSDSLSGQGTFGDGIFAIAGDRNIYYSQDLGLTWTSTFISEFSANARGVAYSPDLDIWVASGRSTGFNADTIQTSPDLVNWTIRKEGGLNCLKSFAIDGAIYVSGTNDIYRSTDGVNFSTIDMPFGSGVGFNLAYDGTTIVGVGSNGDVVTSTDGLTWTQRTADTNLDLLSVAFGNGIFLAVGEDGVANTSSDGITWTNQSTPTTETFYEVTFDDSAGFVAVADPGNVALQSNDGVTYTRLSSVQDRMRTAASGNGVYILSGLSGTILRAASNDQAFILTTTTLEELS